MRYKKYVIILSVAIVLFFVFTFIYNNMLKKENFVYSFIVKNEILKGEPIDLNNIEKIRTESKEIFYKIFNDFNNLDLYVAKDDLKKGQVLLEDSVILKNEYNIDEEYEYISIKAETSDMVVSYNIFKNDKVNIYYTAKLNFVSELLENYSEDYKINGNEESYATIKLLKKVSVCDTFNSNGISLSSSENINGDFIIDTIMIKVKKDEAMLIKNLKNYGKFSFTKVRWGLYECINY